MVKKFLLMKMEKQKLFGIILKLSGEKLLHYVDTVNYVYITEYKKSKLYFVTYYTFDKYAEPDRCIIEERGSTAISIIKFGNVPESGTRR